MRVEVSSTHQQCSAQKSPVKAAVANKQSHCETVLKRPKPFSKEFEADLWRSPWKWAPCAYLQENSMAVTRAHWLSKKFILRCTWHKISSHQPQSHQCTSFNAWLKAFKGQLLVSWCKKGFHVTCCLGAFHRSIQAIVQRDYYSALTYQIGDPWNQTTRKSGTSSGFLGSSMEPFWFHASLFHNSNFRWSCYINQQSTANRQQVSDTPTRIQ